MKMSASLIFFTSILLLLTGCGLFEGEDKKEPAIPGKIVFSMPDNSVSEHYQIYTMNTDGSGIKQLTHFKNESASDPSWSPDGEQIIFSTSLNNTSEGMSLYIMNADGSGLHPMKDRPNTTVPVLGSNARWSPDGTKIAFDFCTNCELGGGNSEIFIYDFETDSVMQITHHPAGDKGPSWSTAGDRLSFISGRDYYDTSDRRSDNDLYEFNVVESTLKRITFDGKTGIWAWNPNNQSYLIRPKEYPFEWYAVDPEKGDTLEALVLNTSIDLSTLIPIKWANGDEILMLLYINYPTFIFYFYNFETEKLFEGATIDNPLGFDWYSN